MQDEKRTETNRPGKGGALWPVDADSAATTGGADTQETAPGRTLRRLLEESGQLDWQDVADLGTQVAEALAAEHLEDGRARRRVTPETILCTRDGLGYVLGAAGATDVLATSASAAEYEAPEVWRTPDQLDWRADQFSLGVVLYEALAGNGRRPFRVDFRRVTKPDGDGQPSIEVSHTPQHDLRALAPGTPERLVRVIERATRLTPANRYESCAQLANALRGVLAPIAETPTPSVQVRRSWWLRAGMAVIALVLAAVVVYFVQPLIVGSRSRQHMAQARQDAERVTAAQFASGLWQQAESHQPSAAYEDRTRLYKLARDVAWQFRMAAVGEASKHAIDFEASAESSFTRAMAARTRAEEQWADHQLQEAARSLSEAEEGFRAAVAARRMRWAAQIRRQLLAEVAKVNENSSGMDLASLRVRQNVIEKTISDAQASPDEFRKAESTVADLRHEVAAAMAEAGAVEVARGSAEEAIAAAGQAQRVAEAWARKFEGAKGPYDRGTAFLLSAHDALDKDPSRALALADAAAGPFRDVETTAQAHVATQRQAALAARKRADQSAAKVRAGTPYTAAEKALARAEATSGATVEGLQEQSAAYVLAKQKFDEAGRLGGRVIRSESTVAAAEPVILRRVEPAAPPAQPLARPTAAPAAPAPAVAAIPPPKPLEPMAPNLARQIQKWMSQHCDTINSDLRGTSDARARCESLTVHDRRDVGQVRVSYTFTLGSRSSSGIAWGAPTVREVLLDCASSNCRCIVGPDC